MFIAKNASALDFECYSNGDNSTCVVKTLEVEEKNRRIHISSADGLKVFDTFFADDKTIIYLPTNLAEKFPMLNSLKIHRSKLKEVEKENLKDLTKLKVLSFRKNKISELDRHVFEDLTLLEDLDLSDNQLSKIEEKLLKSLRNLKTLNLGSNNLVKIESYTFRTNHNIETLSLNDNYLKTLPDFLFSHLENLKILKINSNELEGLQDKLFAKNFMLQELNVADNVINAIGNKKKERFEALKVHNFLYNSCTKTLKEGYNIAKLMEVLKENCAPDQETQIEWLKGEISELNRFKRDDEERLKCQLEYDIKEKDEVLSETRTYLKKLIGEKTIEKTSSTIGLTKEEIKTEISRAAVVFKNELTAEFSSNLARHNDVKNSLTDLPVKVWAKLNDVTVKEDLKTLLDNYKKCDFNKFAFAFVKEQRNEIEDDKRGELIGELDRLDIAVSNKEKVFTLKAGLLKTTANIDSFKNELSTNCNLVLNIGEPSPSVAA